MLCFVLLFASSMAIAQNNETDITQASDNNDAIVDQSGEANIATVTQKGVGVNTAIINQSSNPGETGIIESTIRQIGYHNTAIANGSRKNYRSSTTKQVQLGNHNRAVINPNGNIGSNLGTALTQVQQGNQNFATMSGKNSYSAEQRQNGFSNVAKTSGNSKNADVFQKQVGNNNRAIMDGANFGYASSNQRQFGDQNVSILENVGHDGPGESYVTYQNGTLNTARLFANGYGGVLDISQISNQNSAKVTWTTPGNSTDINQTGFSNSAVVNSN